MIHHPQTCAIGGTVWVWSCTPVAIAAILMSHYTRSWEAKVTVQAVQTCVCPHSGELH